MSSRVIESLPVRIEDGPEHGHGAHPVGSQPRPGEGVDAVDTRTFEQLRDEPAGRAGDEHRHPALDFVTQLVENLRPGRSSDDHGGILLLYAVDEFGRLGDFVGQRGPLSVGQCERPCLRE